MTPVAGKMPHLCHCPRASCVFPVSDEPAARPVRPEGSAVRFVIAYDICDPKRLRRVARRLERQALRTQKSVFVFHGDEAAVQALLDDVAGLMDLRQDIVQAWK